MARNRRMLRGSDISYLIVERLALPARQVWGKALLSFHRWDGDLMGAPEAFWDRLQLTAPFSLSLKINYAALFIQV